MSSRKILKNNILFIVVRLFITYLHQTQFNDNMLDCDWYKCKCLFYNYKNIKINIHLFLYVYASILKLGVVRVASSCNSIFCNYYLSNLTYQILSIYKFKNNCVRYFFNSCNMYINFEFLFYYTWFKKIEESYWTMWKIY